MQRQKHPIQEDITKLYKDIYDYVGTQLANAKQAGKPCLFVLGETHPTFMGKSSLVVEKIFIHVAKRYGIQDIYLENGPKDLHDRRDLIPNYEKIKIENPALYEEVFNKMNVVNHILQDAALIEGCQLIPAEPTRKNTFPEREAIMCQTISKGKSSGIYLVGLKHLKGTSECAALSKKFLVSPVCTQPTDIVNQHAKNDNRGHQDLFNFAMDPKKSKQFSVPGKLDTANVHTLLDMVAEAEKTFVPPKATSTTSKVTSKLVEKQNAPVGISTAQSTQVPSAQQTVQKITASHPTALISGAESTASPRAAIVKMTPPPEYSANDFLQLGLWIGSRFGLCSNPFQNSTVIAHAHKTSVTAEISANTKLQKMGMNFESSLEYLFGKIYARSDKDYQKKIKSFLVDVLNGEVSGEMGRQFNEIANLSNAFERAKQLEKLMLARDPVPSLRLTEW
jgi:hypothetical protein